MTQSDSRFSARRLTEAGRCREKKVDVTATVTMVADLVRSVGGDRVAVEALMGPGVDPHLYKAAASDVTKLQQADVIFYSGLLLEGKMQDIFTNLARSKRRVYAVTEAIPLDRLLAPPEFAGHYDPHVWFDVTLWKLCIDSVVKALSEADPAGKDAYEQRADEARARMDELHAWALAKANELPPERRILVTSHDAYNYFGRAYGFQVVGLQGISTVSEAGLADIAKLTDFIKEKGIKAVFVESSVPHNTIERISRDTRRKDRRRTVLRCHGHRRPDGERLRSRHLRGHDQAQPDHDRRSA